jgi:hypothetical protein
LQQPALASSSSLCSVRPCSGFMSAVVRLAGNILGRPHDDKWSCRKVASDEKYAQGILLMSAISSPTCSLSCSPSFPFSFHPPSFCPSSSQRSNSMANNPYAVSTLEGSSFSRCFVIPRISFISLMSSLIFMVLLEAKIGTHELLSWLPILIFIHV